MFIQILRCALQDNIVQEITVIPVWLFAGVIFAQIPAGSLCHQTSPSSLHHLMCLSWPKPTAGKGQLQHVRWGCLREWGRRQRLASSRLDKTRWQLELGESELKFSQYLGQTSCGCWDMVWAVPAAYWCSSRRREKDLLASSVQMF